MNIESFKTYKLLIELSETEAKKYLSGRSINEDPRVLYNIISLAAIKQGIDLKNKKIVIRQFAYNERICFAVTITPQPKAISIDIKNEDVLLSLLDDLKRSDIKPSGDLYIFKNNCKVILLTNNKIDRILPLLKKYGKAEPISFRKIIQYKRQASVVVRNIFLFM